jgi:carboxypeptidase Taq
LLSAKGAAPAAEAAATLGALLAAQLFRAARAAVPDLESAIARGDFAPLMGWLRERVHGVGSRLGFDDLVREATGGPPAAEPFLEHLRTRYLE